VKNANTGVTRDPRGTEATLRPAPCNMSLSRNSLMTPAQGIEKLGFRRWYERQLIEGHLYFVTCFLSLIAFAACLEQIEWRGPLVQQLTMLALIVVAGVLCIMSLRRYNFLVVRAETLGAQSSCSRCNAYGVLKVIGAGRGDSVPGDDPADADNPWIRVRCKKCGHEWRMDNA